MDEVETSKMVKKRTLAEKTWHELLDWLIDHILWPVKGSVSHIKEKKFEKYGQQYRPQHTLNRGNWGELIGSVVTIFQDVFGELKNSTNFDFDDINGAYCNFHETDLKSEESIVDSPDIMKSKKAMINQKIFLIHSTSCM